MSELIRVFVVDDHHIVRRGLAAFLIARNGMQVVGEAATGEEAIVKARHLEPDVILMDLMMPGIGGLEATRIIHAENPAARILVLTSFDDEENILAAIQAGARGFLRKDSSADELFTAIRGIAQGGSYLQPEIMGKFIRALQVNKGEIQEGNRLSERELDVLAALTKGMSNQQIADLLVISQATVRTHVRNILVKLGVNNRTEAAVYAKQSGILSQHRLDTSDCLAR